MGLFSKLFNKEAETTAAQTEAAAPSVLCPVAGTLADISTVADQAFASKTMGDGVAIVPTDSAVIAPVTGSVDALFPTGHAFGITGDNGITVMVHVGIDTVEMQGDGFTLHVAQGERVEAGQKLLDIDIDKIRAAGFDPVTMCLVAEHTCAGELNKHADGTVTTQDTAIWFA